MPSVVEAFRAVEGGQLRVVATMESLGYEIEFMRDDLEGAYHEADLEAVYRSLMANQVSADDFRRIAGLGGIDCQLFLFEEVIVFLFPSSRYEGVFVSYDREEPFPFLDVVDAAGTISHLPEGSSS